MGKRKYNIEIAKQIFKNESCELLETVYKNNSIPMKYKCKCGDISKISLACFKKRKKCSICSSGMKYRTFEEVYQIFKKEGYELLEKEYINANTPMKYKCPKGHENSIRLVCFLQRGQRCNICNRERNNSFSKNKIEKYFNYKKIKLISIYRKKVLSRTRLYCSYICTCGRKIESRFNGFKKNISLCHECSEKKRIQTNLDKYGFTTPNQHPDIKKIQSNHSLLHAKNAKIARKNTMMKLYGVGYTIQMDGMVDRIKETMMKKYGVPSGAYLISPCSKESQRLFFEIHKKLSKNIAEKNHFGKLNAEFVACFEKQYFKYDFVNTKLKKAIEYNGYSFHPKAEQDENEIGWCAFHPNKTVKEAKEYEKKKYLALEKRGYKILTVWDYEFKKNPKQLVQKCIDFLLS